MIPEALLGSAVAFMDAEYWRTRRGPLVLLAVAVTHTRAILMTLRWMARQLPGLWRVAYPQAVKHVRSQG